MLHRKQDGLLDPTAAAAAAKLYDTDPVLWSEQQAELLSMVWQGGWSANIDWANVVEEIESVGRSQINAVESLLLQTLVHEFKIALWPDTIYGQGWINESLLFQAQAAQQFTPSMRQRIDVSKLVHRAARAVPPAIDGVPYSLQALMALFESAQDQLCDWLSDPDRAAAITLRANSGPSEKDLFQRT